MNKIICLFFVFITQISWAQELKENKLNVFVGYELGEAVFNKFQSLSGEIGVQFKNQHQLRLAHMNVNLTKEHLATAFAGAVDGPDVKGKFLGLEAFYDIPVFKNRLFLAPSIGYFKNEYNHTLLDESLTNSSLTFGGAISFTETDIFKVKGLYYRFSIPMRTPLNRIKETQLGSTIIKNNAFDNNLWLFIGYKF